MSDAKKSKTVLTDAGIEVPLYLKEYPQDYSTKLGDPGQFPYTRGVQNTMYRGRLWTMRQYAGFGNAEESNKRYKMLLAQGTMGLSVAFDLPTQIGYDCDHALAEGEVGKVGVSISSLEDMEVLLDGIPLDQISTSMTINATAAILLCLYVAVAKKRGVDIRQLSGTIQNDVLKEYIARGTYIYPPKHSMRIITDIFRYCTSELPKWNMISISGYHIREAGSTAVQELAFTFANAIAYVEAAVASGQDVDQFASRLSFFFNAHNNFFEEIGKFRAARRIWAHIIKERFGANDPKSMMLRFHTQTGGSTLTAQQPYNNIPRVTLQALSAVLGGTQSLHTNSFDEALALPTEDSARIALRTQQVIAYESGVAQSVDPLAGSYLVEQMTDEIETRVMRYLKDIDAMGGSIRAIESGYFQSEIAEASYRYQKAIETKAQIIVGVNDFKVENDSKPDILQIDTSIEKNQKERIQKLRARRDNAKVQSGLEKLAQACRGTDNILPCILESVEAYATLGEIADTMRNVFGEYKAA
ncbi:MAG TPA: methylmalonyl-CoA mutase family protein [bacterium]|nr:methylmalonyl-CoA mutase family protein [bacterium]